jgi:hypothetical protein
MDENRRRRVAIAKELVSWGVDLPAIQTRIKAISIRLDVSGRLKLDLESKARQMTMLFNTIGEIPDSEVKDEALYDRLIANTDRLRDLIVGTNASLDGLPAAVPIPSRSRGYPSKPTVG